MKTNNEKELPDKVIDRQEKLAELFAELFKEEESKIKTVEINIKITYAE